MLSIDLACNFIKNCLTMFEKTNIEAKLSKLRDKRSAPAQLLTEVHKILNSNENERAAIRETLNSESTGRKNSFDLDLLVSERLYHLDDIKKLCVTYRLRFLDARFFKGEFPEEAISQIRHLEKTHKTTLTDFKIVAPAKLLKLENADDPLLFAPMGNNYFYLIHKWGNDLHPLRKLLMWPYKSFENLVATIFLLSIIITSMMPLDLFSKTHSAQEYIMLLLFVFKGMAGIALFYGFAKGKNFNGAIWNSKFYNS